MNVDELDEDPDASKLQVTGPGVIGYSRAIRMASPSDIRDRNHAANPPPPVLGHEGIEDAYVGNGSVILFWSGSRWLKPVGSDDEHGRAVPYPATLREAREFVRRLGPLLSGATIGPFTFEVGLTEISSCDSMST